MGALDSDDATYGNPAGKKQSIWQGLVAPGEVGALVLAFSIIAGAAIYVALPFEPDARILIGIIIVLGMLSAFSWRLGLSGAWSRSVRIFGVAMFGVGLGLAAGMHRVAHVQAPTLTATLGPTILEGWVTSVEPGANGVRLRIRTHAISGLDKTDTPKFVRVTHRLSLNVSPGRFVRCFAVLRPPPGRSVPGDYDFQRAAWFQQLGAVGYVQGRCRGGVLGEPAGLLSKVQLQIGAIRRQVAVFVNDASGEKAGGFAAALVSGDRSFMADQEQESLRRAGLAHLLAISGLHLGIVGGLIYFVARFALSLVSPLSMRVPVQKPAAVIALIGIAAYLVISGASVSTQRAFIMYTVFFAAILIDRPALSLRSFSIAMIGVVLFAPESVFAPGFQMSFAATGILIAIYESWSRRRAFRRRGLVGRTIFGAQSLFVTSVSASLATAPFALFHFERLAPLGLAANLTAMPVVSLLSVPSAALSMFLAPFGQSEIGLYFFGQSLAIIMSIADWTVAVGEGFEHPLSRMPGLALLLFVTALIGGTFLRRWLRFLVGAIFVVFGVSVWALSPQPEIYWAASGDVYFSQGSGQYRKVTFVEADALGPLRLRTLGADTLCDGDVCRFEMADGYGLVLQRCDDDAATCPCSSSKQDDFSLMVTDVANVGTRTSPCRNTVHWSDVQSKGGVALRISRAGIDKHHTLMCGPRPWRPACPAQSKG